MEIKQTNPVGGKINVSLNGGKGCTVKIKLKKALNTQVKFKVMVKPLDIVSEVFWCS